MESQNCGENVRRRTGSEDDPFHPQVHNLFWFAKIWAPQKAYKICRFLGQFDLQESRLHIAYEDELAEAKSQHDGSRFWIEVVTFEHDVVE